MLKMFLFEAVRLHRRILGRRRISSTNCYDDNPVARPLATTELGLSVDEVKRATPDIHFMCSYIDDSAGLVKARCVIIGAGPLLGLAIAERFAVEGFAVYALSRKPELLLSGIAQMRSRGLGVVPIECDVGQPALVEREIRRMDAEGASCDVLVYNAFVENGHRVSISSALASLSAVISGVRGLEDGALLFSTYAYRGESGVRALVKRLADSGEAFGFRVGMVTIDGELPAAKTELAAIADLYWDLFFSPDRIYERELRIQTSTRSNRTN